MDNFVDEFSAELEQPLEPITIEALNQLCSDFRKLREEKSKAQDILSEIETQISAKQNEILRQLDANKMKQHRGEFGLISVVEKMNVQQPLTTADKLEFFKYLQQKDIFIDMVSVNSIRLKSWVNEMMDNAAKQGDFAFKIPGLEAPTKFKTISLKK